MMNKVNTTVKIREELCIERKAEPCCIIIFGASGDLTRRKLLPSLFNLHKRKLLPPQFYCLGFARTEMSETDFKNMVHSSISIDGRKVLEDDLDSFVSRCFYVSGDYDDEKSYKVLSRRINELDEKYGLLKNRIFYLSTPPTMANSIIAALCKSGLTSEGKTAKSVRVIIEKPFGNNIETAQKLDRELHKCISERQIYRIDHYLGKETVQNIMMLRFANSIFEPVWNNQYIDHVQITVAESLGVEHRAGYYEKAGVLRDMFQNHMMQILSLVAMEPPVSFDADHVRDEKVKILKAIRPFPTTELEKWIVRGQYIQGVINGQNVNAYRDEHGVAPDSKTETFAAARMMIDNPRWRDVPFYLRSGKRLPKRISEVAITFKKLHHSVFAPIRGEDLPANVLVLNIQPDEGIGLTMVAKHPGPRLCMASLTMDFAYSEVFEEQTPDAYERLLLDAMLGDQTLFIRSDMMEMAWSIFTPVLKVWEKEDAKSLHYYPAGTWGPNEADKLIRQDGRYWREL